MTFVTFVTVTCVVPAIDFWTEVMPPKKEGIMNRSGYNYLHMSLDVSSAVLRGLQYNTFYGRKFLCAAIS